MRSLLAIARAQGMSSYGTACRGSCTSGSSVAGSVVLPPLVESRRGYRIVGQGPLSRRSADGGSASVPKASAYDDPSLEDAPVEVLDHRAPESIERVHRMQRMGQPTGSLIITCEHASNRLPAPYSWPKEDEWIKNTHW